MLVRLDHVARVIVNANDGIVRIGCDVCIADRVWLDIPQAPEWQLIGDQTDAAFIFARAFTLRLNYPFGLSMSVFVLRSSASFNCRESFSTR